MPETEPLRKALEFIAFNAGYDDSDTLDTLKSRLETLQKNARQGLNLPVIIHADPPGVFIPNGEAFTIAKETVLNWVEGLGYACNDVDLDYHDEEAEEQVRGVYGEIVEFCKTAGIDLNAEMELRGTSAEKEV